MPNRVQVGVYRTAFPFLAESFIFEQAFAMRRYEPVFLTRDLVEPGAWFPVVQGCEEPHRVWKRRLYALSAGARFFGHATVVKNLRLLHAHFATDGLYALSLAETYGKPLVVTFHGGDLTRNLKANLSTLRPSVAHLLLRAGRLHEGASLFLAVSDYLAGVAVEKGFPREKVRRHYLGVDTDFFSPGPASAWPRRYVLSIAKHVPVKGLDTLLRAFARVAAQHPGVDLLQVGAGPLTAELKALAAQLGLAERVVFLGPRSRSEVRSFLRGADAFVLSSRRQADGRSEALGLVVNEASACGVPVVVSRNGGIPEAVIDNETGFVVDESSDQQFGEALDRLLGDASLRSAFGSRGREFTCDVFNRVSQTAKLEQIYDEVCA